MNELLKDIYKYIRLRERQAAPGQTKYSHLRKFKDKMIECKICKVKREDLTENLHRHRIDKYAEYTDDNVLVVCRKCHIRIHEIERTIKAKGETVSLALISLVLQLENEKNGNT